MKDLLAISIGALGGSPLIAATLNQITNLEIPVVGAFTVGGFLGLFVLVGRIAARLGRWTGRVDTRLDNIDSDIKDMKSDIRELRPHA
jgi:hypothetical protein